MALNKASTEILSNLDEIHKKAVFLSDALPVLDASQNPKKKELHNLVSILFQPNARAEVALQWIPAHYGVYKNESANILVKEVRDRNQHDSLTPIKMR